MGHTWLFQVMPVFFLVGGYVSARSWTVHHADGRTWTRWVRHKTIRLPWPTAVYVLVAVLAVPGVMAAAAALVNAGMAGAHLQVAGYANYLLVWGSIHQRGFAWQARTLTSPWWRLYALARAAQACWPGW